MDWLDVRSQIHKPFVGSFGDQVWLLEIIRCVKPEIPLLITIPVTGLILLLMSDFAGHMEC